MSKHLIEGVVGMLEVMLEHPEQEPSDKPQAVVIIAHPHPAYGGSMENKVVHTIARACNLSGLIALRFNFRGVGKSEGDFDNGIGEQEDLVAVIQYAKKIFADKPLALAGFSFGAAICISQANKQDYEFLITVAPPIYGKISPLKEITPRWGLFMGEADEVVTPNTVRAWLQTQKNQSQEYWFNGVGHFFHGRLPDLREKLVKFIQRPVNL